MGVLEQYAEIREQEGRLAERELIIANLLKNTELSLDKIASLTNVTEEFVTKIKESIKGR